MRLLFHINLIAIVVLAAALARSYEGAPLPWAESWRQDAVAEAGTLRILTEGAYPPFNYRDDGGSLAGFDIDVARALCERMRVRCSFSARRWSELLPALKRGEADAVIASLLIPASRRGGEAGMEGVIFTGRYYSTPGRFAARKDNMPAAATASGLSGRRVAVQAGSIHEAFLKAHFAGAALMPVPSLKAGEEALAAGEADLLFADRNALLRWILNDGQAACCRLAGMDYTDPAYFGAGAGIALRSSDEALRGRLDAALSAIVSDGTYARISTRYFGQNIY